ncbi:DUF5630 domain-containing protein [Fluoribacter dumoffii]|nr:DUF5630 domain-containing protein [Fluoribacter dumoffii]MCW8385604.1 DUF5630 domain-containing protein [Fluoribacter dumoffii]MCW8459256.1 DUF5630 domain-containing protein [Fluoribacter dumoffii]
MAFINRSINSEENMKLAQFLELNTQEEHQQIKILSLKKNIDPDSFNRTIKNFDQELLLKLAIANPEIDKICKSQELESHWEDLWRLCGLNPKEYAQGNGKPVHEYQPMCTTPSCFDLLKGLYLYETYRKVLKNKEDKSEFYKDAEEYLATSGLYGCYFSLNALCMGGFELLSQEFNEEIAKKIIFYAQIAAQYYLSPGYLLLANCYQELLKYQDQSNLTGLNLRLLSFKAMSVAQRLESYSGPMLNNAYQGKTLSEASNGKLSSFSQALFRLQTYLGLSAGEIEIAMMEANHEATLIKSSYQLEIKSFEDNDTPSPTFHRY